MSSDAPGVHLHDVLDLSVQPGRPPLVRAPANGGRDWAGEYRDALLAVVDRHGAVLVRGLGLRHNAEVAAVFGALAGDLMPARDTFATRTAYGDGVYSSSAWPPDRPMCMHHELSYAVEFPRLMLFACLRAPVTGGATALADSRAVLDALPAELVERFEREGWTLTRSYHDDVGVSWAEAFGVDDRAGVEKYCQDNEISFTWLPNGALRTRQRRPALIGHPVTGERCWFNQVAFLNEWTMAEEVRSYMVDVFGREALPFNTTFGGGDPIDQETVQLVNEAYEAHTIREPWRDGDLMVVDNIRTAHSREAYAGPRAISVGMGEPVRLRDRAPGGYPA
jgi:hypothetical protein